MICAVWTKEKQTSGTKFGMLGWILGRSVREVLLYKKKCPCHRPRQLQGTVHPSSIIHLSAKEAIPLRQRSPAQDMTHRRRRRILPIPS